MKNHKSILLNNAFHKFNCKWKHNLKILKLNLKNFKVQLVVEVKYLKIFMKELLLFMMLKKKL
jgi:hypothetical protein